MLIVIPMCGPGERFRQAGYTEPKPLIKIAGKTMINLVLASYPIEDNEVLLLIPESLKNEFSLPFEVIHQKTKGPVETILNASKLTEPLLFGETDILIADCDSVISKEELTSGIDFMKNQDCIGGTFVRRSKNPNYSYAELDEYANIIRVEEKNRISEWSTTGPYWWRSGQDLQDCLIQAVWDQEYSIAPVYNYAIHNSLKVKTVPTSTFYHLGSPDELRHYVKFHDSCTSLQQP